MKKVYVASDHAGVKEKELVKQIMKDLGGFNVIDLGPADSCESVDYPDYAKLVCGKVNKDKGCFGILICGTGIGMTIAANKVKGIRAALGIDEYSAVMSRAHNNANVLVLRARKFNRLKYKKIVKAFFETEFSFEERHVRRVSKLE